MMGSGVFANVFTLEHARVQKDIEGVTVGDALQAIGYAGGARAHRLGAYFEAHIEQGPVLENEMKTIGVVQGALGQRWYDVTVTGQDAHAGPTPMDLRRDALIGASRFVLEVNRIARSFPDYARGTVGFMQVKPNSRNVIPGEVRTSVDFRNARASTLDAMCAELERAARAIEAECRVRIELRESVYFAPSEFDAGLVASVREAAGALGYSHRDIVSGAGHDAVYIARIAPTAMIFIPCEGGISHNEIESATPADLAAGCNVLLHAALRKAGIAGAARAAA
jgi:N-carbamoyl-L-amino-acid hydrolase